jgi:NAD(P)-dependent dehydrogenase (short-subunit alcohol dehydrogenase family)
MPTSRQAALMCAAPKPLRRPLCSTEIIQHAIWLDAEMLNVRTPEQNRHRLQLVPMKRMGAAEEVAALVLFLLSDESGYITGAEVAIDGGASL